MGQGVVPTERTVVGADDLGLTRGDGVFDATRVHTEESGHSRIDHLEAHLDRLGRSVVGLGDPHPDLGTWRELIIDAVEHWQVPGEATLKIMYTRGGESVPSDPVGLVTITHMSPAFLAQRDGIKVATLTRGYASDAFVDAPWLLGGVKTLSYAVNVAAKREAHRRGADDVLFTFTDGYCMEGPTAALIAAFGSELVTTPLEGTGVLASITQHLIYEHAPGNGWQCSYRLLTPAELLEADTVWMVSSVRGAAPVTELDGQQLRVDVNLTRQVASYAGF